MGRDDYYMPEDYENDFSGIDFGDDNDNENENNIDKIIPVIPIEAEILENQFPKSTEIKKTKSIANVVETLKGNVEIPKIKKNKNIKNLTVNVENIQEEPPIEAEILENQFPKSEEIRKTKYIANVVETQKGNISNVEETEETKTDKEEIYIKDLIDKDGKGITVFFNIQIFESLLKYKEFSDYIKQIQKNPNKSFKKTSLKKEKTVAEIALKYNIQLSSNGEKLIRSISQDKNIINSQISLRNTINSRKITIDEKEKENIIKIMSEKWDLPMFAAYLPKTNKNYIKSDKTYNQLFEKYGIENSFKFDKFKRSVSSLKNGIDYNNLQQILRERILKTIPEMTNYFDENVEKFKSVFIEKFNLKPIVGGGDNENKYYTIPKGLKKYVIKGMKYTGKNNPSLKDAYVLVEMKTIPAKFYNKLRKWFNENKHQENDFKAWLQTKKTDKKKQIIEWLLRGGLEGLNFFI